MSVKRILEAKKIKLISCRPRDTIETVAEILTVNKIGALPVRDGEGKLIGIISQRDVMAICLEEAELETNVLRDRVLTQARS